VYSSHGNSEAFGYSNEEAWELAQRVIAYALTDFPGIRIYLTSANRTKDMSEQDIVNRQAYNAMVKEFAEKTPGCFYLDTFEYEPLGRQDIFVEDGVHFNAEGYRIYGEFFKEALKEELEQF
jgi:lysophospholipase L1-like esterase